MSEKDGQANALLQTLFDPNATDSQINKAISSMIKMDKEEGLTPKEDRPRNKKQACELLAKQSEDTVHKELLHYLNHYYKSIEVAKLVARHPNIGIAWLARFMHFLPDDAKLNPRYEEFQKDESWQKLLQSKPERAKCKYGSFDTFTRYTVGEDRPHIFKVKYWLSNGSAADKSYIASLNKVDEALLRSFANDKSPHVRKALAKRKNISVELASVLVTDKAKTIRQALAENDSCPEQILTSLTQDSDQTVIKAALANSSCPTDAIHAARLAEKMKPAPEEKAVDQLSSEEIIELLGDVNTQSELLSSLSSLQDDYVLAGVALHRNCPQDLLITLSECQNKMVKESVAFNSNTPANLLKNILQLEDSYFHLALASNPNLSEQAQLELIEKSNDEIRLVLADTTESETVWRALIESEPTSKPVKKTKKKTWRECLELCLNPKGKDLYALQRSRYYRYHFVNKLIARHPKCTNSLKQPYAFYSYSSLAKNPKIALQLLENPNAIVPKEYAEWKIKDWLMYDELPGHVVKYYLNNNHVKYARKGVLSWTAQIVDIQPHVFDEDIHIRKNIASLKSCTEFMFEVLARDVKESVRAMVVANPNCPENVLAYLFKDKVATIRVSATNHKNFNAKLSGLPNKSAQVESLKNKGPKRNRIKQAKETKSLVVLRDLAGDKVLDVRLSVIENKKTPLDVLEELKDDESEKIRSLACGHDNSSLEICKYLFQDSHETVRLRALRVYVNETSKKLDEKNYRNRSYDETTLKKFQSDESELIIAFVAEKILDVTIQKRYAQENNQLISKGLARNFNLDQDVAFELIKSGENSVITSLVRETFDKDVFIATLIHDEVVSNSLWRNSDMCSSLEIQKVLVTHKNPKLRGVAADYATDVDVLMLCVEDNSEHVLKNVSYNNALTTDHLKKILDKANPEIMSGLYSSHEKYLKKNLSECLEHSNEHVRAFVTEISKLNKKMIENLASDPAVIVRKALLENYDAKLSDEIIESLRNDESEIIRRAVKWRYD